MIPFMFLVVLFLDLGFTDTNNIGKMCRKSKCHFCTIFFSLSDNSGLSCQYMGATGKLALPGNFRVLFDSKYLNLGSHRAEICTYILRLKGREWLSESLPKERGGMCQN